MKNWAPRCAGCEIICIFVNVTANKLQRMATNHGKWYVVWEGTERGIYDSWAECEARVKNVPGARYKSFPTQEDAIEAYRQDPDAM